jgi:hypothetical protein
MKDEVKVKQDVSTGLWDIYLNGVVWEHGFRVKSSAEDVAYCLDKRLNNPGRIRR